MENVSLWTTLGLGFVLGLKHALDTDHIVAVSTLVARERSFWRSARIGALWGLGHTLTLLIMGLLIVGLGWKIPDNVAQWLEMAVAAMLILLGARALWEWRRGDAHLCVHQHEGHTHAHFHRHGEHQCADVADAKIDVPKLADLKLNAANAEATSSTRNNGRAQSFLVGAIHGLSGSAALMLLVLSTIRHPIWGLVYIGFFGVGMMLSMFVMSAVFSFALSWTSRWKSGNWRLIDLTLRGATGLASLGFGLYLAYQIGVVDKMLMF